MPVEALSSEESVESLALSKCDGLVHPPPLLRPGVSCRYSRDQFDEAAREAANLLMRDEKTRAARDEERRLALAKIEWKLQRELERKLDRMTALGKLAAERERVYAQWEQVFDRNVKRDPARAMSRPPGLTRAIVTSLRAPCRTPLVRRTAPGRVLRPRRRARATASSRGDPDPEPDPDLARSPLPALVWAASRARRTYGASPPYSASARPSYGWRTSADSGTNRLDGAQHEP
jgi:hypothetical protein